MGVKEYLLVTAEGCILQERDPLRMFSSCLVWFLNHYAACIAATMASAMPDKEKAAESSPEMKEEEQQVGALCKM